jgi:hypothetical protein
MTSAEKEKLFFPSNSSFLTLVSAEIDGEKFYILSLLGPFWHIIFYRQLSWFEKKSM